MNIIKVNLLTQSQPSVCVCSHACASVIRVCGALPSRREVTVQGNIL